MTTTQHVQAPMRMPRTVSQALMFLERHGHNPIMTPDGILVVDLESTLCRTTSPTSHAASEGDYMVDVPYVFPVVGNVVDLAPIREWQGY